MSRIIESSIRSAIKRRGGQEKSRISTAHKNFILGSILDEISDEEIQTTEMKSNEIFIPVKSSIP